LRFRDFSIFPGDAGIRDDSCHYEQIRGSPSKAAWSRRQIDVGIFFRLFFVIGFAGGAFLFLLFLLGFFADGLDFLGAFHLVFHRVIFGSNILFQHIRPAELPLFLDRPFALDVNLLNGNVGEGGDLRHKSPIGAAIAILFIDDCRSHLHISTQSDKRE
jgi:hypothetical protein